MSASLFGTGGVVNVSVNGSLIPQSFVGTAGQTLFTLTAFTYTLNTSSLLVFINGQKQVVGRDFVETSTSSFTLIEGVVAGDYVDVIGFPEIIDSASSNTLRADLASITDATKGPALSGFKGALAYTAPNTVGNLLYTAFGRTAAEITAGVTPTNYGYAPGNVKRYGAVGDGVADDSAAINAADSAACSGALGLDGLTVLAQSAVYFPPGNYKVSTGSLTYRGAPWRGAGLNTTFLKFVGSAGPALDCVGSLAARKLLSIRDMTFDGIACTGTAYGLRLGHNYRSNNAFSSVRITGFPGPGLYFRNDVWNFSAHDLYMSFNARLSIGAGMYVDPAVLSLIGFDWFNLQLENNGFVGSGFAGGIELNFTGLQWNFHGGIIEGNYGDAEVRFSNATMVNLSGTYFECDLGSTTDGIVFQGNTVGTVNGITLVAQAGHTGVACRVRGTAAMTIDAVRSDHNWPTNLAIDGAGSVVNLVSEGMLFDQFTVANGCSLNRTVQKRVALTDAATIALDASRGTSFYVTLAGNRTMGTPTGITIGQRIVLTAIQDATGGRTLAFNGSWNVTWSNAGNTATRRSVAEFEYDGTYMNQVSAQSPFV